MTMMTGLVMVALLATIISLFWGIGSMAFGGNFDAKHSTHLMFTRVFLQGLVVVLLLITFLVSGS